uniref:GMC oxidoreductase n=1 Tax=Mycobacterium pinniadriaticum TaxID=2994102 RepID=UPI00389963FE
MRLESQRARIALRATGSHRQSRCRRIYRVDTKLDQGRLRVRGVEALRVADASAFPRILHANTNAAPSSESGVNTRSAGGPPGTGGSRWPCSRTRSSSWPPPPNAPSRTPHRI